MMVSVFTLSTLTTHWVISMVMFSVSSQDQDIRGYNQKLKTGIAVDGVSKEPHEGCFTILVLSW